MKIERATFLMLTASIAGGCQSREARPQPAAMPRPTPVASVVVDVPASPPADPVSSTAESRVTPAADLPRCDAVPEQPECPEPDLRVFCRRFSKEFRPDVALEAIACLAAISAESPCDPCAPSRCGMQALRDAQGDPDPACQRIETECDGMGAQCEAYSTGMNAAGRARFHACLRRNCGLGVRYCLWDPSVSSCVEGSDFIYFQF